MRKDRSRGPSTHLVIGILIVLAGVFLAPGCPELTDWARRLLCLTAVLVGMTVSWVGIGVLITGQELGVLWTARNVYSLSRLQMTLWSLVILSALCAAVGCRAYGLFFNGNVSTALEIDIPQELLQAMGISLLSGAIAPAVLSMKAQGGMPTASTMRAAANRTQEAVCATGRVFTRPRMALPMFADLLQGDDVATAGTVDLSKLQQLTVTLLLVGSYLVLLCRFFYLGDQASHAAKSVQTALPTLSPSFIYLMGVSHAGYLAYKAAPTVSPAPTPQAQTSTPMTVAHRPQPPSRF